jgi:fibronectin-binding autotransporter adhesin
MIKYTFAPRSKVFFLAQMPRVYSRTKYQLAMIAVTAALATASSMFAGSATWKLDPQSSDWNTAANWMPETVPNGTTDIATFDLSNVTDISIATSISLGSIVFDASADSFSVTVVDANFDYLSLVGGGVVNNSGATQYFYSVGDIGFSRSATAGDNVVYDNRGGCPTCSDWIYFHDNSNAGNATFFNRGDSAGADSGYIIFDDTSSGGTSTIINELGETYAGIMTFYKFSTAGASTITVQTGGFVEFEDSSTADTATLIADGGTFSFSNLSTGGSSMLIADGGTIYFTNESNGELAQVQLTNGGILNVTAHKNTLMAIGSLEGDSSSQVQLGRRQLTIGGNGLSTTFDGLIKVDALQRGSLVKTGSETLILTHANSYGAGTTITGGTLIAQAATGSATGTGPVQVNSGTLGGTGNVTGAVTIGTGTGPRAFLAPGVRGPGTLSILNTLTLKSDGSYKYELGLTPHPRADQVSANGVTIETGAMFVLRTRGNQTLPLGTVFTVINNTAATPISGVFANLADGSTFTVGNNTFQVSYEGGDGNDLTLTVVP